MRKIIVAMFMLTALAGCAGSKMVPDPVGIGSGPHELKQSPCACNEVPMTMPGSMTVES